MMTPPYKPYIGRIFCLKKTKLIPASEDKFARTRKHYKNVETFGEACLIVDETNTRVQVTTISEGKMLWIGKFFLSREVAHDLVKNQDHMDNIANKLVDFSTKETYNVQELRQLLIEAAKIIKQFTIKR